MASDASGGLLIEDVTYRSPDGAPLLCRLYRPTAPGPHPAVVSVHGGRWCAETRLSNADLDSAVAASGIIVMALDFRMPPQAQYPVSVSDINFAIRWLKSHEAAFDIRDGVVGGIGTSSGGHQLLLTALNPENPYYGSGDDVDGVDADASLSFVVLGWPVTDPLARYHYAVGKGMDLHVQSHHAYWRDEDEMTEGSPQRIVDTGTFTHLPPCLVIQGGDDVILAPGMIERFVASYEKAAGSIDLRVFEGEGHTFVTKRFGERNAQVAVDRIVQFIHRQAGAPSQGPAL